jgi:hypothetical protein
VLRDGGLAEFVFCEDEILEYIRCCCATTTLDGIVNIIIATANTVAVENANRFLIGII